MRDRWAIGEPANGQRAVGLSADMQATKAALPIMRRQGSGAIVNTASISVLFADYGITLQRDEGWRNQSN